MNFIRNLAENGLAKSESFQERRAIVLTNYVSLILFSGIIFLFFGIIAATGKIDNNPMDIVIGAPIALLPLTLNKFSWTKVSRLFLCIAFPVYMWYVFILRMSEMEIITATWVDGLRLYLLATSLIPYLVFTRKTPVLFALAILPTALSIVFFESIFNGFGITLDFFTGDHNMMQVRFILSYIVVSGGCYMLQNVILKSDELNSRLIASLEEKKAQIECQNQELMRNQNELAQVNQHLEQMVEERAKKISEQRDRILSYAYANAHYVRGPIARLMGLVELYKIDKELDCDWLLKTIDRETKDIDTTIRKISAELQSVE